MPELLDAFFDWLGAYRSTLTAPGLRNLVVIVAGWIQTTGRHAITQTLVVTDVARRRHHEAFHRFFSRGTWHPDHLARWLFERLRSALHIDEHGLRVVLDDTLAAKKGPHVFGIGSHLDAVRSTRRFRVFCFGHCWVVLAVLVRVPFQAGRGRCRCCSGSTATGRSARPSATPTARRRSWHARCSTSFTAG